MICENSINFYECNLMICEKYWWNLMICEKYWRQSKLQINDYMLDLMPGEGKTYLSYDIPLTQNGNCDGVDDVHTLEFQHNKCFRTPTSQDKIEELSSNYAFEKYWPKVRIMQWNKVNHN